MQNLITLRKANNLTQKELAQKLNITDKAYWSYESGRTEPSIDILVKIADYFDVSLDYLCGRQNSNLVFIDSLTDTQKKIVEFTKHLNHDQSLVVLGFMSNILNIPYSETKPFKPKF